MNKSMDNGVCRAASDYAGSANKAGFDGDGNDDDKIDECDDGQL